MPKPRAKSKPRKKAVKKQRGGMTPANPRVDTPPSWAQPWMYQGRGQGGGPFAGQMPASMTNRNPQAERERMAAFQSAMNERYQGRLGTGIGGRQLQQPPRRPPPPPIRPGYQGGGELDPPLPSPRMTQEDRRRRGRAPGGRRRGAGAPMGIPPQVARILQKLRNVPSLPPGY